MHLRISIDIPANINDWFVVKRSYILRNSQREGKSHAKANTKNLPDVIVSSAGNISLIYAISVSGKENACSLAHSVSCLPSLSATVPATAKSPVPCFLFQREQKEVLRIFIVFLNFFFFSFSFNYRPPILTIFRIRCVFIYLNIKTSSFVSVGLFSFFFLSAYNINFLLQSEYKEYSHSCTLFFVLFLFFFSSDSV